MPTLELIQSFERLAPNWAGAEGCRFSHATVASAIQILEKIAPAAEKTDAFPGLNGEVMVTGYKSQCCIELTVEADGTLWGALETRNTIVRSTERIQPADVDAYIAQFKNLCNAFEYFLSSITTPTEKLSSTLRSSRQRMAQEYQGSIGFAPWQLVVANANTSVPITNLWQGTPRSSGTLTQTNFPKIAA